jgi:hypothetical protein
VATTTSYEARHEDFGDGFETWAMYRIVRNLNTGRIVALRAAVHATMQTRSTWLWPACASHEPMKGEEMNYNELLVSVDWDQWKRKGGTSIDGAVATVAKTAAGVKQVSEAERVALLVLGLGRHTDKKETKLVRIALREIEQAVLSCEQDIDYL